MPAGCTKVEWSLVEQSDAFEGSQGFVEERQRSRPLLIRCQSAGTIRMKMCDLNRQRALNDEYAC